MTIDVVIPSKAGNVPLRIMTEQTIQSLRECESSDVRFNIIVCEQIPDVDYKDADWTLHYEFPFHFHKVLNMGARIGDAPYILFSNSDMIYHRGFAEELLAGLEHYDSVSPQDLKKKWYVDSEDRFIAGYKVSVLLKGWSFMVKRDVWESIGRLDEDVYYYHSDYLYADQLKYYGFTHALCTKAYAIHLHNFTSDTLPASVMKKINEDNLPMYYNARRKYVVVKTKPVNK